MEYWGITVDDLLAPTPEPEVPAPPPGPRRVDIQVGANR